MHDRKRASIEAVRYLLNNFPCVAILGARQVGKTTFLKQVLPDVQLFDLEKSSDYDRISLDPEFFLKDNPIPLILDEAQLCPELFSALRVKVDENRKSNGQYLISGSSSPELLKNISESLAGRIAIFELGTFSLDESWGKPMSPFFKLIEKKEFGKLLNLKPNYILSNIYESVFFGGYPESFLKRKDQNFFDLWLDNYIATYINRDIRRLFPKLNINNYKKFIKMISFASGQTINISNFARSLDVAQPTAKEYFDIASGTFIWRMLPSYHHNIKRRIIKMPKGYIRDTGLICKFANINSIEDLKAHPNWGLIWESFIIEHLIKSFQNSLIKLDYYYYRTSNQAEIDFIIEGKFGIIPIEIKTGSVIKISALDTMQRFIEENKCPVGIIINNGPSVCKLTENIYQIPAVCL